MKYFYKKVKTFILTFVIILAILPQTVMAASKNTNNDESQILNDLIENEESTVNLSSSSVKYVYSFLVKDMRLPSAAACGIMANMERESGFNAKARSPYGSYGLCQWTGSRYRLLKKWCKANGYNYTTARGQLNFLKCELSKNDSRMLSYGRTIYNNLLAIDNSAQGAFEAAAYWCKIYERPSHVNRKSIKRGHLSSKSYWPVFGNKTTSISAIKAVDDGLKITLEKSSAKKYDIYRSTDGTNFNKIASTKSNTYIDKNVSYGTTYYYRIYSQNHYSTVIGYEYIKGAKISKVANSASNSASVKWVKNSDVNGYQIQYSTSRKFKHAKSIMLDDNKTTSAKLTKLAKGKTYYIRIRTYKISSGKKYYSAYSPVSEIEITK